MVALWEIRGLASLLVLVTAIGLGGAWLALFFSNPSGDVTADYTAKLVVNRSFLLEETYVYHVHQEKYRMLYRSWHAPLLTEGELDQPYILLKEVTCTDGTPYVKDHKGNFKFLSVPNDIELWEFMYLAEKNEAGFIDPDYFEPGDHRATYLFQIFPPIESDGEIEHLNLKLADEHVPYPKVRLVLEDPNGVIEAVYPHLRKPVVRKVDNSWVIAVSYTHLTLPTN